MSKLDQVKEKINLLKYWIGILIGVFVAVAAWLFNNVETVAQWKVIAASFLMIACIAMIVQLNLKLNQRIDSLEDL